MREPTPARHPTVTASARRFTAAAGIVTLGACGPIEDAPPEVSTFAEEAWMAFHEGSDEALGGLAADIPVLWDPDLLLEGHVEGSQAPMTAAMNALVDAPDAAGRTPFADARPLLIVNRYACDLDVLERILYHLPQDELYDDYDTYERTYRGDIDAYKARTTATIGWDAEATASYFPVGSYRQTLLGDLRRVPVPAGDDPGWTGEEMLVTRTYLPEPAEFDNDKRRFDQDYQLELFLPWDDGEIVHVYFVWRYFALTFDPDTDPQDQGIYDPIIANLFLGGFVDWDVRTEEICAEGGP